MVSASAPIGPSPARQAPPGHLPGFDGMRGLAAVAVLLYHALWRTPALRPAAPLLGHGDIGVEVFFVMSGFLVARPIVAHVTGVGRPVPFWDFWRKRVARIWPAYLVALAGALAIGIGRIDGLSGWVKHGLLIQTWFEDRDGTGLRVSWTLVVEVAFYALVLPLGWLAARAGRRGLDAWVALCLLSIGVGSWAIMYISYGPTDVAYRVLLPYLPGFGAGMLLAAAAAPAGDERRWSEPLLSGVRALAARPWVCAALSAGTFVALVALMPANRGTPAVEVGTERAVQSFVQVVVVAFALAPLALGTTRARLLEHRGLTALGVASFGFYLWHIQVLRLLRPALEGPDPLALLAVAAGIGLAYLAGEASRRWVEEPARRVLVSTRRR